MDQSKIKIIIADEHYLFRQGIKAMLSSLAEVQVIEEAATAAEALQLAETHAPDLLMLDAALSDPHFDLIKRMKERRPQTRVLLVSNSDQSSDEGLAAEAGAAGWLTRNSSAPEIVKAICDSVPQSATRVGANPSPQAANSNAAPETATLTRREQEVLQFLMSGNSSRQIAEALSLSIKTVEAHKFNLMRKLDVHNRAELIKLAIRNQIGSYVKSVETVYEPA